ncbi:hypothetical protein GYMLUDRAFT_91470 [Collybiopsis luxurians FD-317 M1]|nr:hypothetical protein GYMLUDRAFT_91470 [Collybiopsis luxurians FD-317 M1]
MPLVSIDRVDRTFDYIVIGGGTAGLTLASRLSENPDWSVLVLEAGNSHLDDHPLITRPAQYGMQFLNPEYDWAFKTAPQKFSDNREYLWSRGKGLGGSSAMNFSVWTHPPKEDVDNWEKLGNPGWNWANYEKYSTRALTYTPLEPNTNISVSSEAYNVWDHNKARGNGPLHITHPRRLLEIDGQMHQTLLNMGHQKSPAPYHGETEGTYLALSNVHHELHCRTYSATASALHRPNFFVLVGANVTAIISSSSAEDKLEATGVEFHHVSDDKLHRVFIRKEVILSAGALKSPQILELSGIGRPDVLSKLGIAVKVPLDGVGENVQEHQFIGCSFELKDDYVEDTYDLMLDEIQRAKHEKLYSENEGIHMTGVVQIAFAPLKTITSEAEAMYAAEENKIRQDIEEGKYPPGLAEQYEIQLQRARKGALDCELISLTGVFSGPKTPRPGKKYYTILGFPNHNFSRGTIHISSIDPHEHPVMDPHYFEHEIDLQIFIKEVRYIREIVQNAPLKDLLSDDPSAMELNPGPEVQTDEEIASWLKQTFSTAWHTIGSLSMLPKEKNGVVDPTMKVYGTKNIRVVDLSVVPMQIAAHTQATAFTIAEQAADIIKGVFVP